MANPSYAIPLLAVGMLGLAGTCLAANGFGAPSMVRASPMAAAQPELTATPVSQPAAPAPARAVEAAPAPARVAVNSAVDDAARAEACQAEVNKIVSENPLDFLRDRIELTPRGKAAAAEIAVVARACSGMKFEIQAHTDKTGKRQNNIRLSRQRAEAVKNYLVGLGLSPGLMTAVGFGPDRPVASNRTASGRARNRRIEFRVSRGE